MLGSKPTVTRLIFYKRVQILGWKTFWENQTSTFWETWVYLPRWTNVDYPICVFAKQDITRKINKKISGNVSFQKFKIFQWDLAGTKKILLVRDVSLNVDLKAYQRHSLRVFKLAPFSCKVHTRRFIKRFFPPGYGAFDWDIGWRNPTCRNGDNMIPNNEMNQNYLQFLLFGLSKNLMQGSISRFHRTFAHLLVKVFERHIVGENLPVDIETWETWLRKRRSLFPSSIFWVPLSAGLQMHLWKETKL